MLGLAAVLLAAAVPALASASAPSQLEELPGWDLAGNGRALERTYLFPTLRAAVAFVALVAEVGEAEGYVPDVDLRHLEVTLRVATSTEAGVIELDFDYYHEILKESPEALGYLESRGLTDAEAFERLRLGFANRMLGYRLPGKSSKAGGRSSGVEARWCSSALTPAARARGIGTLARAGGRERQCAPGGRPVLEGLGGGAG